MAKPVVHRFWIGPLAKLPALCLVAVSTWSSCQQNFWVYDLAVAEAVLGSLGVSVRDANTILPSEEAWFLLGKGASKQHVKDLFSFRVVYAHGGWFADLDYMLLRPTLCKGFSCCMSGP